MPGVLILALNIAILFLVLGLAYAIVTWAAGLAGIGIPVRVLQIVFAIIALVLLVSLLTGYAPTCGFGFR